MTISVDGNPVLTLRGWAKAYREGPAEYRFPSDPHAEFFPRDMEMAADEIERLRVEIDVRDRYINRDLRAQIDAAFEQKRATGKFSFED